LEKNKKNFVVCPAPALGKKIFKKQKKTLPSKEIVLPRHSVKKLFNKKIKTMLPSAV